MTSGETLRFLRLLKGVKQETIAKKLGISQPAYSKLENKNYDKQDSMGKGNW